VKWARLIFNGCRASSAEDEKVLEMDGGVGYTTLNVLRDTHTHTHTHTFPGMQLL
jgi:hypothetical protein